MIKQIASPKSLLYRAQWVFLVVSVVPLAVLAYICVKYLIPILQSDGQDTIILSIYLTLGMTVLLSVLGYILSRRNTMSTINSIESSNKNLSALLNLSQKLSATKDTGQAISDAAQAAAGLVRADAAVIYSLEEKTLVCKAAHGVKLEHPDKLRFGMGEGIVGDAAFKRKTMLCKDVSRDDRFVGRLEPLTALETGSKICYPMTYQERVVGVIDVIRRARREPLTEADQHLIEMLGQQTCATILNTEFHASQQNYSAHVIELLRLSMESDIIWEEHLYNVARTCNLVSRALDMDEASRRNLHFAAMLHDIGFLKMRKIIGQTEAEGFNQKVREHPVIGAQLIEPITVWKDVAPLILHHHEFVDGSGYPKGLKHEEIPLGARIICAAEAMDAMTNPNSYARNRSVSEALAELETASGTRYDPKVVKALAEVLEEG